MIKVRFAAVACACVALAAMMTACQAQKATGDLEPTAATAIPDLTADPTEHESGPESPIAYGLRVPKGAVQVGPLIRIRSEALIAAYQPELQAALQQKAAEAQQEAEEALENGETVPLPAPTPSTRPSDDTFDLLDEPPRPDTTISLMRIDGNPSAVVARMIAQIAAALPKNSIDTQNLSTYCAIRDQRYTGCYLNQTGVSVNGQQIRITMTVDPGDLETRLSPPAAQTRPLMTVSVKFVGDPKEGQAQSPVVDLGELPEVNPPLDDAIVWPKMDLDAEPTVPLLDGTWTVPQGASLLLSGRDPRFVVLNADNGRIADDIAHDFVASHSDKSEPDKDIVEDLNEISTTYRANSSKKGLEARATYIQSGRGTYVMLFFTPPATAAT